MRSQRTKPRQEGASPDTPLPRACRCVFLWYHAKMKFSGADAAPADRAGIEDNDRLCDEEWKRGLVNVSSVPRLLTIETTSICNLRCVMCGHGAHPKDQSYQHFPESLTPRLRGVIRLASHVQLHGLGEPLMNPAFWKMLDLTHENQHVQINSNGQLLDKGKVDRILTTNLSEISFSLDAATAETYRKIRDADFGRVVENLRYLIAERRRLGRTSPHVSMNMTLMRENIEETVRFVELAHELKADQVQFGHLNRLEGGQGWRVEREGWIFDYCEQMLVNDPALSNRMIAAARDRAQELGIELYLDWAKQVFYDDGEEPSCRMPDTPRPSADCGSGSSPATGHHQPSPKDCNSPWNWMLIRTNGDVHACCFGTGRLGTICDFDPLEIWNGQTTVALRHRLLADDIHPVCSYGVCKFVNGRPCREDRALWSRGRLVKFLKSSPLRSVVGETVWGLLRKFRDGTRSQRP